MSHDWFSFNNPTKRDGITNSRGVSDRVFPVLNHVEERRERGMAAEVHHHESVAHRLIVERERRMVRIREELARARAASEGSDSLRSSTEGNT